MLVISRQPQVLREIDLYAVAFPNRESGQHVQIAVEDSQRGLGETCSNALLVSIKPRAVKSGPGVALAKTGDRADRQRDSENLHVVVIHLIAQSCLTDLVQAL